MKVFCKCTVLGCLCLSLCLAFAATTELIFFFLIKTLWLALGQSQKHKINRTVLNYKGFNA